MTLVQPESESETRTSEVVEKAIFSPEDLGRLEDDGVRELVPHSCLSNSLLDTRRSSYLSENVIHIFIKQTKLQIY